MQLVFFARIPRSAGALEFYAHRALAGSCLRRCAYFSLIVYWNFIPGSDIEVYSVKNKVNKAKLLIMALLNNDKKALVSTLFGKYTIGEEDVKKFKKGPISDTFTSPHSDLSVLIVYMDEKAYLQLQSIIKRKKKGKYTCNICYKVASSGTVQCDSCDCWIHFKCAKVDKNVRDLDEWFCPLCVNLYN